MCVYVYRQRRVPQTVAVGYTSIYMHILHQMHYKWSECEKISKQIHLYVRLLIHLPQQNAMCGCYSYWFISSISMPLGYEI